MWRMSEWSGVDVENEQAEWMWTISEEDKVFTCVCKFGMGGADAGRTVWTIWRRRYCVIFYFRGQFF